MIRSKDGIKIFYDREADVLYVTRGKPEYTTTLSIPMM